ncbi:MAG: hypothetical protein QXG00_00065 [Candidatus Woesearchaeota archaeon]
MYHIGKIIEILNPKDKDIISNTNDVQVVVEMWDENIMTVSVDESINDKIKKDDIVVVDYKPISEKMLVPKQLIIKIIRGNKAEKIWKMYKDFFYKGKVAQPKQDNKYFG